MTIPPIPLPALMDEIREDHLRLAVLLDLIQDNLAASQPVGARLAQLRMEFDRHAHREEEALATYHPTLLESHRRGHDRMRLLLTQLSAGHDGGRDIGAMLGQIVGLFTGQLMPADQVFASLSSSAP